MKIAVSGKGGVGKTLVSGVLANFFVKKGYKVLAIDVDPTPNLALTLGIPLDEAKKLIPISENVDLLKSKTRTDFEGVYRLTFNVSDVVEKFAVKSPYDMHLLVMGTVKTAGGGCTCPSNAVIRALIRHLFVERDEVVVMDMEAGVEHMGRGTAKHVDMLLIVTDTSLKSLDTAEKLHNLARETGIQKVFMIGNKVRNSAEEEVIRKFAVTHQIQLLGLIPHDETVLMADMKGETPLKHFADSAGLAVINDVGEKILELKS